MPHLLTAEPAVLVATTCPACSTPHACNVDRTAPPPGAQMAPFLTPAAHIWDDVLRSCSNQLIFCEGCVEAWLDPTHNSRGYVMDMPTPWHLASDR